MEGRGGGGGRKGGTVKRETEGKLGNRKWGSK